MSDCQPGAGFSKVPKFYRSFSGVILPFVSQERRGFKSSNFKVIFLFFFTFTGQVTYFLGCVAKDVMVKCIISVSFQLL